MYSKTTHNQHSAGTYTFQGESLLPTASAKQEYENWLWSSPFSFSYSKLPGYHKISFAQAWEAAEQLQRQTEKMHIGKGGGQREISSRYDILVAVWMKYLEVAQLACMIQVKYCLKALSMR